MVSDTFRLTRAPRFALVEYDANGFGAVSHAKNRELLRDRAQEFEYVLIRRV
jgi:hypothetical protein